MKNGNPPLLYKTVLPSGIKFFRPDNVLEMTMGAGTNANMQEDGAAFEAWALVAAAKGYDRVVLSESGTDVSNSLHYNRFLYRALRFKEAFKWFTVSEELQPKLNAFRDTVLQNKNELYLNFPGAEASDAPQQEEAILESRFASEECRGYLNGLLGTNIGKFHRQLPVGLYKGSVNEGHEIFPSKTAAVDLWGIEGPVIHLIELKASLNKKIGVLSELFFYACFVRDMFVNAGATMGASEFRGYPELARAKTGLNLVRAHILTPCNDKHRELEDAFDVLAGCESDGIEFTVALWEG